MRTNARCCGIRTSPIVWLESFAYVLYKDTEMIKVPEPNRSRRKSLSRVWLHPATLLKLRAMANANDRTHKAECTRLIDAAWVRWREAHPNEIAPKELAHIESLEAES